MRTGTKIITLDNGYHLWTNTQGSGKIHLLALHGGPGGNHEYWEDTADQLKKQGLDVQVTMYDQLGSLYSDQPDFSDPEVAKKYLTYDYFLDEVEEVRQKLGIDNFYLIGQSWGGLLVQEYAVKYGQHLKGAIISSMVDEIDEYVDNVNKCREETLPAEEVAFMKACEQKNDYDNERYQRNVQILNEAFVDRKQLFGAARKAADGQLLFAGLDTRAVAVTNDFAGLFAIGLKAYGNAAVDVHFARGHHAAVDIFGRSTRVDAGVLGQRGFRRFRKRDILFKTANGVALAEI